MHFALLLTALLGVSTPALGMPPEQKDARSEEAPTAEAVAPGKGPAWDYEVFARGGLAGLAAGGEVVWTSLPWPAAQLTTDPYPELSHFARKPVWGVGIRTMRGRWGFEAQYQRITTNVFQPGSLILETSVRPLRNPVVAPGPENLLTVQGVLETRLARGGARLFAGVGAGAARAGGADAGRIGIVPFARYAAIRRRGEEVVHILSNDYASHEESADRLSFLVSGSVGITFRRQHFFVRPRVDVLIGQTRHAESSWDVTGEVEPPDRSRHSIGLGTDSVEVSVRPIFVLFSVDIGWSSRR